MVANLAELGPDFTQSEVWLTKDGPARRTLAALRGPGRRSRTRVGRSGLKARWCCSVMFHYISTVDSRGRADMDGDAAKRRCPNEESFLERGSCMFWVQMMAGNNFRFRE